MMCAHTEYCIENNFPYNNNDKNKSNDHHVMDVFKETISWDDFAYLIQFERQGYCNLQIPHLSETWNACFCILTDKLWCLKFDSLCRDHNTSQNANKLIPCYSIPLKNFISIKTIYDNHINDHCICIETKYSSYNTENPYPTTTSTTTTTTTSSLSHILQFADEKESTLWLYDLNHRYIHHRTNDNDMILLSDHLISEYVYMNLQHYLSSYHDIIHSKLFQYVLCDISGEPYLRHFLPNEINNDNIITTDKTCNTINSIYMRPIASRNNISNTITTCINNGVDTDIIRNTCTSIIKDTHDNTYDNKNPSLIYGLQKLFNRFLQSTNISNTIATTTTTTTTTTTDKADKMNVSTTTIVTNTTTTGKSNISDDIVNTVDTRNSNNCSSSSNNNSSNINISMVNVCKPIYTYICNQLIDTTPIHDSITNNIPINTCNKHKLYSWNFYKFTRILPSTTTHAHTHMMSHHYSHPNTVSSLSMRIYHHYSQSIASNLYMACRENHPSLYKYIQYKQEIQYYKDLFRHDASVTSTDIWKQAIQIYSRYVLPLLKPYENESYDNDTIIYDISRETSGMNTTMGIKTSNKDIKNIQNTIDESNDNSRNNNLNDNTYIRHDEGQICNLYENNEYIIEPIIPQSVLLYPLLETNRLSKSRQYSDNKTFDSNTHSKNNINNKDMDSDNNNIVVDKNTNIDSRTSSSSSSNHSYVDNNWTDVGCDEDTLWHVPPSILMAIKAYFQSFLYIDITSPHVTENDNDVHVYRQHREDGEDLLHIIDEMTTTSSSSSEASDMSMNTISPHQEESDLSSVNDIPTHHTVTTTTSSSSGNSNTDVNHRKEDNKNSTWHTVHGYRTHRNNRHNTTVVNTNNNMEITQNTPILTLGSYLFDIKIPPPSSIHTTRTKKYLDVNLQKSDRSKQNSSSNETILKTTCKDNEADKSHIENHKKTITERKRWNEKMIDIIEYYDTYFEELNYDTLFQLHDFETTVPISTLFDVLSDCLYQRIIQIGDSIYTEKNKDNYPFDTKCMTKYNNTTSETPLRQQYDMSIMEIDGKSNIQDIKLVHESTNECNPLLREDLHVVSTIIETEKPYTIKDSEFIPYNSYDDFSDDGTCL